MQTGMIVKSTFFVLPLLCKGNSKKPLRAVVVYVTGLTEASPLVYFFCFASHVAFEHTFGGSPHLTDTLMA